MKVLITGATGLIGRELVKQCLKIGVEVNYLTTSKNKINKEASVKGFYWSPSTQEIDVDAFKGVSAIINLAGASVSKRWTPSYKNQILESRIATAALLKTTLESIEHEVDYYLSASGISAYPSSFEASYSETFDGYASSFLGEVTKQWEHAANSISELGIKVAMVRTGIVMDRDDGAFPKIAKPVRMGVGAALGSGKQYQSWIHIRDIAGIYLFLLQTKEEGVFNGVAPMPITNEKMTKDIAVALTKRIWMPNVPKFMLKILLGEMGALALESQNVSASKMEALGYQFQFSNFDEVLTDLL